MNYRLEASNELLERLGNAVVNGRIVMPPITQIELDDVPGLNGKPKAEGKTVITF